MPSRGALTGRRRWTAAATGPPIAPIGAVWWILRARLTRCRWVLRARRCLWIPWSALILPMSETDRLRKPHLASYPWEPRASASSSGACLPPTGFPHPP